MTEPIFRDRDAYGSIRGYAYQIDRTVDHWLNLLPGHVLELEKGEDIDLVGQALAADGTDGRVLEQVKYRETSITLRTPSALEAMANFHDHRSKNPGQELSFCYVTNATAGTEQLSPFEGRTPGITLWHQVRQSLELDQKTRARLESIRLFLRACPRPAGTNVSVWDDWQRFLSLSSVVDLKEYVDRFRWLTEETDSDRYPVELSNRVFRSGLVQSLGEAHAIVDRLVVFVLRLLSRAGLKRLTTDDREKILSEPTLEEADRILLIRLRSVLRRHEDRIGRLESSLNEVGRLVNVFAAAGAPSGRVDAIVRPPDLSIPPPVNRLSERPKTVANLAAVARSSKWLALYGRANEGKSQLARLLAFALGDIRAWIRFHHDQSPDEARRMLGSSLTALLSGPSGLESMKDRFAAWGGAALVVLDDLPRIPGDDPFVDDLVHLFAAATATGVRLLSTSQFELPLRFTSQFGAEYLAQRPAPAFLDDEAQDLFRAYGAPEIFLTADRRIEFLNAQAGGHPLLLSATAEFLSRREWQYHKEEVESLLRGDHTQSIIPDVIGRLVRTLSEPARELLYRLTLPFGSFDWSNVAQLGSVDQAVPRLQEQFHHIQGTWVLRDTLSHFTVSPLVKTLGETELAPSVRAGCYLALADAITFKKVMDLSGWQKAVLYYVKAGEPGRALSLYVFLLADLLNATVPSYVALYVDLWRQSELPAGQSVGMQLMVRGYQLAVFTDLGLDTEYLLNDVDQLVESVTERDAWGLVAVAVHNIIRVGETDPVRMLRYIRQVLNYSKILGPDGQEINFDRVSLPDMLWMMVVTLKTTAILSDWLETVAAIHPENRRQFWESEVASRGVWLVGNKLYMTEWEKPKSAQDWNGLLLAIDRLIMQSQSFVQPRIEAALTVTMIQILGELNRPDDIQAVASRTLDRWATEPDVQFRIRGSWGREFAAKGRTSEARLLLDIALAQDHTPNDHERLRSLMAANLCADASDLKYAIECRDLARTSADAPPIVCARALGEYALAAFLQHVGRDGAVLEFSAWSECVRAFLAVSDKDKIWRDQMPLVGHVTGYLTALASDGRAPSQAYDGSPFHPPTRGFFMREYFPAREALYHEADAASIALLMYRYAASAGEPEATSYWIKITLEEAERSKAAYIHAMIGFDGAAELLTRNKFFEAVEMGVMAGRGLMVSREKKKDVNKADDFGVGVDLDAEFVKLPEAKRHLGEAFGIIAGAVPLAIKAAHLRLSDPTTAMAATRAAAGLFRELADREPISRDIWTALANLFEAGSAEQLVPSSLPRIIQSFADRAGDNGHCMRILAYLLAAPHASPGEALMCQLGSIELLLRWYAPGSTVYRLLLCPYIEAFWRQTASTGRFAFRSPDRTEQAIIDALGSPTDVRVREVLTAAASGFRIAKECHDILGRLGPRQS